MSGGWGGKKKFTPHQVYIAFRALHEGVFSAQNLGGIMDCYLRMLEDRRLDLHKICEGFLLFATERVLMDLLVPN